MFDIVETQPAVKAVVYCFSSPGQPSYVGWHGCKRVGNIEGNSGPGGLPCCGYSGSSKGWQSEVVKSGLPIEWAIEGRFPTYDLAKAAERTAIATYRDYGVDLWNISDGGDGFTSEFMNRPEFKARHAAATKAALADPEVRAKISANNKVAMADPEVREKISANVKVALADPEVKARQSANIKAALADPEVRAKMSANIKAALADPEIKARQSANIKASKADPEVRAKMSANNKATMADPEVKAKHSAKVNKAKFYIGIWADLMGITGQARNCVKRVEVIDYKEYLAQKALSLSLSPLT